MIKLNKVGKIIEVLLKIVSCIGVIVLLSLYSICKLLSIHYNFFIIMIYPCGLVFLYLVYQFIKLFSSLKDNNPFCFENVKRLKNGIICSFIISILVIIATLISIFVYDYYSLQLKVALLFISFIFFGVGVALYILSELFKEATIYKEENDLTI